jgi:hypothetical protein
LTYTKFVYFQGVSTFFAVETRRFSAKNFAYIYKHPFAKPENPCGAGVSTLCERSFARRIRRRDEIFFIMRRKTPRRAIYPCFAAKKTRRSALDNLRI